MTMIDTMGRRDFLRWAGLGAIGMALLPRFGQAAEAAARATPPSTPPRSLCRQPPPALPPAPQPIRKGKAGRLPGFQ